MSGSDCLCFFLHFCHNQHASNSFPLISTSHKKMGIDLPSNPAVFGTSVTMFLVKKKRSKGIIPETLMGCVMGLIKISPGGLSKLASSAVVKEELLQNLLRICT